MDDLKHIMPLMIPIIAIVMGIGIGMLALWLDHEKKTRMFELHHKERLLAIERGMEVPPLPPEFFTNGRGRECGAKVNSLHRGLALLLLGLALGVALFVNEGPEAATWALLPIALGVAQLIFYRVGAAPAPEVDAVKSEVNR
ncbi:MAG: DUF6249 domain-containing protein [Rhodoferax sp.]|uniref:DUF6249 domain-containing protein n=1 Tax=Rhodoferax sp. TaxID=50421 RepID=UPI0026316537|nr:DUF6249 domain-containing protein [Rhodoferax sp.]MDD5333904.1 DUF6249 domain-containing protein [Rhodoferax sp.]